LYKIPTNRGMGRRRRSCKLKYTMERMWEPSYLKAKCEELGLEEDFQRYRIRLMISYLGVFYPLHIFVTILLSCMIVLFTDHKHNVPIHLTLLIGSCILILLCLAINFHEKLVNHHEWILTVSSFLAIIMLLGTDMLNCLIFKNWILTNSFDTYLITMIYIFLPIPSFTLAIALSTVVSLVYTIYFILCLAYLDIYSPISEAVFTETAVDLFHYLCYNVLGIFYRVINDTMVRSSFLNCQQLALEEHWLLNARKQEAMLLDTILPTQISKSIQKSIRDKIVDSRPTSDHRLAFSSVMAIQIHPDVTILYADMVNYTHLTNTLPVKTLVMVLHELYGRFDVAASKFHVQRIKFLGDCYYCVAGLGEPNPDHATCAVSLGMSMIATIQEVCKEQQLGIDIRIGVHSGCLFAGVIGEAKLQLDIWGPDVDIANLLESTGEPGYVHISSHTLVNLDIDNYTIKPGTARAQNDPVLQNRPMSTYLVTGGPPLESVEADKQKYASLNINSRPRQHSLNRQMNLNNIDLTKELSNIPVGGFKFRCCREDSDNSKNDIGSWCISFKDSRLEWEYLRYPDYILKYSVLLSWVIGSCLILVQILTNRTKCSLCIFIDFIVFFYLTTLLGVSWFKCFCYWRYGHNKEIVYGQFSCRLFYLFESIQESTTRRIFIYLSIIGSYLIVISLLLVGTSPSYVFNATVTSSDLQRNCSLNMFQLAFIEAKLYHHEQDRYVCFNPWCFINMASLILGASYTFVRIPFSVRTVLSLLEAFLFLVIVVDYKFAFHSTVTTVPHLPAEYAHCARMLVILIMYHMKERQVEFNTKTNFKIVFDLQNQQEVSDAANKSIKILLRNLLPEHIGKWPTITILALNLCQLQFTVGVYLSNVARNQLYSENYSMVSVMFATITNFKMDLARLRVLNMIISEFDNLLYVYKEYFVVEKIKVVGCTYMAACGLDKTRNTRPSKRKSHGQSTLLFEAERNWHRQAIRSHDLEMGSSEAVFVMVTFALDLMRTLSVCNAAYASLSTENALSSGEICIGISSGEVMAGVVGASQPQYDIWGNAVNLASRMQSTGLPGHIQVTEETASILSEYGISTTYRGMTFVKGVGEIPTYFVDIDDNFQFIRLPQNVEHIGGSHIIEKV
ncbi:hypothetical protein KR018_005161, partial [Drosophila ironensis]